MNVKILHDLLIQKSTLISFTVNMTSTDVWYYSEVTTIWYYNKENKMHKLNYQLVFVAVFFLFFVFFKGYFFDQIINRGTFLPFDDIVWLYVNYKRL